MIEKLEIHSSKDLSSRDISDIRISRLQQLSANLFATQLLGIANGEDIYFLTEQQREYFEAFNRIAPVHHLTPRSTLEKTQALDLKQILVVISNHPPFEKTMSPSAAHLAEAFIAQNAPDVFAAIKQKYEMYLGNIPAGIARRAVLYRALQDVFPNISLHFHTISAQLNPPLDRIQAVDGSITVPYKSNGNGYEILKDTFIKVVTNGGINGRTSFIVGFPEGGNSKTVIEEFGQFRTGIFSVTKEISQQLHKPAIILPVVMAVDARFETEVQMLSPIPIDESFDPVNTAETLRREMYATYKSILSAMPEGYYWQGMGYPYGGVSKSTILSS